MSDNYASMIPTEANWQPTMEAANRAEEFVRAAFPDPDGMQQEITVEFHDQIIAVDAGQNLSRITCPHCDREIPWTGTTICSNRPRATSTPST